MLHFKYCKTRGVIQYTFIKSRTRVSFMNLKKSGASNVANHT